MALFSQEEYLFMISQEKFFINELVNKCKGANYPAVSNKDIKSLKISLHLSSSNKNLQR